ncbi:BRWD3 [Bugula neritina]|uniref:BRWD3 n=1 Tax=Bugula neritina TaxID=10212 RepID=A0A7J7KCA2_BUGNE|nr:BRWD3 [Bugula neritina]
MSENVEIVIFFISFQLLPKRIDWEGNNYPRQYEELVSTHPHIATDHLKRIVSRLPSLLEDKYPPNVRGVLSLLGAGNQSLLRSEKTADVLLKPSGYLFSQHDELLPLPNSLQHPPHMLRWLQGSEYTGIRRKINTPADMFNNYQLHRRFVGHLSSVYCVLYDRTGRYIFTGCDDHLVKIWSAVSGRLLASLRGHSQEIGDFAVNYENTMLASGSCDKTVRIWCLKTTECLAVLQGHSSTVTSLNFCPLVKGERRYLVSTSEDATVCFWHYEKSTNCFAQRPLKFVERSRTGARMLCSSFSQGGMFLATGSTDSVIRIYSFPALQPEKIAELEAHSAEVDSIRYSNSSERFISGSKDGTARIWRNVKNSWFSLSLSMKPLSGESSRSEQRSSSALRVNMVEWTVDDKLVLTAVSDFSVRVWCSVSGNQIRALSGHMDDVFVIECTALHSHLVVTAGHDGHLKFLSSTTLSSTTLSSTTLLSTSVSSTTLSSTTLPSATLPSTTLPSTTLPSTTLPSTTLPSTTLPSTTLSSTTLSSTTLPSTSLPSTTLPSTTLPSTTLSSTTLSSTTLLSTSLSSTTVQSTSLPSTTLSSTILPSATLSSTTLPSTTLSSTTLSSTTLSSTTLPSTTLSSTTLSSTSLSSSTLSSTSLSSTTLSSATLSSTTVQSTSLPSTTLSSTTLSSTSLSSATLSSTSLSSTTLSSATLSSTTVQSTTLPSTTLSSTTLPSTTLPSTTLPSTTLPSTTLPSTTLPSTTLPSTILPSATLPSTTLPSTTLPSTTLSSTTLPSTILPSATLSSTTLPSTTLPSTTLPSTILPSATLSSTTLPSTL